MSMFAVLPSFIFMEKTKHRLQLLGLPVFDSQEEFADILRLDEQRLSGLIRYSETRYHHFLIPKKTGGERGISCPTYELKAVQAWILRNILDRLSPSEYATAYVRGKNLSDNISPHRANRFFLSVDIENFFPNVSAGYVMRLFQTLGYSKNASYMMTRLCTLDGGLPQGGVTSPALSNLVCSRLDRRIGGLASHRNLVFTRYADDITLSSNNRHALHRSVTMVEQILSEEGFKLNEKKTRLLGPRVQCQITGLVKNSSKPLFGVGRKKKVRMRAVMHNLLAKKIKDSKYPSIESIEGWLSFLQCVDPGSFEQMNRYWANLKEKYLT